MKNIVFSVVVIAFIMASCDQKSNNHSNYMNDDNMMNEDSTLLYNHSHNMNNGKMVMNNDSTMMYNHSHNVKDGQMMMNNDSTMTHKKSNTMENHVKMYACSMHPEVIGKKDEKCSKCGMNLTEPVPDKKE